MKRNAKFKRSMEAVALILPTVLIYTLVIAYPLLNMTYTSFFTWDGIPTSPYIFVGWENYHKFFTDIIALTSLKNVIIIMLVSVLGVIPIAFFLATVISKRFFANRVVKAVYFLPVIINKVAIGLMFTFILYPKVGPFVKLLEFFGLNSNVNVLGNMDTSIWVCAFVVLFMVVLLPLRAVPATLWKVRLPRNPSCRRKKASSSRRFRPSMKWLLITTGASMHRW